MRFFALISACLIFMSPLGGCAIGSLAESSSPAYTLPASSSILRVRVLFTKVKTRLDATGPYQFQLKKGGKSYQARAATTVRAMSGKMVFGQKSLKGDVVVSPAESSQILRLNGRRYRGILVFHPSGGSRYDVVEYVDMEEYLYGVLPREVGIDWPLEALKAQAVVSRTYALSNKITDVAERFDVSNTVQDQVYGGMDVEAPESNRAVEESRGEILVDGEGKPVQTFFHSSCGGMTELPGKVWKSANASDVFACVSDEFCVSDPHYKWHLTISYSSLRSRLRKAGIRVSDIKKVGIVRKTASGRVDLFGVETSHGFIQIPGNRFRLAVGPEALRSTFIIDLKVGKSSVSFDGRGWGHGVGLCQWGARGRALAGQNFKQILETYYPKAKLSKI